MMITNQCISLHVSTGRAAGVIIDTPPSFASPSSGEHRNNLINACIESFKGLSTFPPNVVEFTRLGDGADRSLSSFPKQ